MVVDNTDVTPTHTKDYGDDINGEYLHANMPQDQALNRIRTAGSISISPELFEKLYLAPQNQVKGDLRKTFGNPTPLAIIGFLLALSPLACDLMGWRGTGGPGVGAASVGPYYFFGGLLMILGSLGEWVLGNTFPFVVFGSFGAFWLALAATFTPANAAVSAYGTDAAAYYSSFAFFYLAMGLMCFVYLICSVRTNVAFFIIFLTLVPAFGCLSGAYWQVANENTVMAGKLQKTAGALLFITCAAGWWIFLAIMLQVLDMPFGIPVGDLSNVVKGASDRRSVGDEKV